MTSLDLIKQKINTLYQTHAVIHISIAMSHPKVSVRNDLAVISGIYPHIFQVEECGGKGRRHTLQYTDILTENVKIAELDEM